MGGIPVEPLPGREDNDAGGPVFAVAAGKSATSAALTFAGAFPTDFCCHVPVSFTGFPPGLLFQSAARWAFGETVTVTAIVDRPVSKSPSLESPTLDDPALVLISPTACFVVPTLDVGARSLPVLPARTIAANDRPPHADFGGAAVVVDG